MPAALGNLCPNRRPDKAFTPHAQRVEAIPDATLVASYQAWRWQLLPAHLTPRIAHQFHFAKLTGHRIVHDDFPLAGLP